MTANNTMPPTSPAVCTLAVLAELGVTLLLIPSAAAIATNSVARITAIPVAASQPKKPPPIFMPPNSSRWRAATSR